MSYFKENIDELAAYIPGEQPGRDSGVVKLNQNENPYPPSPKALEVLREFGGAALRVYPDPMVNQFRRAVAEVLDVPAEWILPGDGSDDLIVMINRAAIGPARAVAYPVPTFPFYQTQAQIEAAACVEVRANDDFSLPIEQLAEANAAVTFVSSPNSPTGASATVEQLDWLAGRVDGLLVIDEAYADFADQDAISLVAKCANVIVLRTLSKGYSLAGLRLGFGIAGPELMEGLVKAKAIYNVGPLVAAVGAAAISDQQYHRECVTKIRRERARLREELVARGLVVWPSGGNFVMVSLPGGDGLAAFEALKARGVLVRYFDQDRMQDKLRITVGTKDQNDSLLAAWDQSSLGNTP